MSSYHHDPHPPLIQEINSPIFFFDIFIFFIFYFTITNNYFLCVHVITPRLIHHIHTHTYTYSSCRPPTLIHLQNISRTNFFRIKIFIFSLFFLVDDNIYVPIMYPSCTHHVPIMYPFMRKYFYFTEKIFLRGVGT